MKSLIIILLFVSLLAVETRVINGKVYFGESKGQILQDYVKNNDNNSSMIIKELR